MRRLPVRLAVLLTLLGALVAHADTPQSRYDAAREAMQRGRFADAESGFRAVTDDPDAPADLRAQALFSAGLMQQNQRRYEDALRTYADVQRRFPESPLARRAADAAATLTAGGGEPALAFRRRFDEAMDAYVPARDLADRGDPAAAGPGLEHALALLAAIERDFPDDPRRKDVAFLAGATHAALARFVDARDDYARALALAAGLRGDDTFATLAQERIADAVRSRRRQVTAEVAWTALAAIAIGLVLARPWSGVDAALLRLGARVGVATVALAGLAVALAWGIREYVDDHSPVTSAIAATLVLLPGLTGIVVSLGYLGGLRAIAGDESRWPVRAGAIAGALAALAVAACVVNAYALFPFLDSML